MTLRILVVDDDSNTLSVVAKILKSGGHDVASTTGGADALDRLRASTYDVLVTDLVMPDISGHDLVTEARTARPSTRCVIMSGHNRPADYPSGVAWITKPIDIDELFDVVEAEQK